MPQSLPRTFEEAKQESCWPLVELFHENTKLNPITALPFAERVGAISQDEETIRSFARSAKTYPGRARVELPRRFGTLGRTLYKTLRERRTRRDFSAEPLRMRSLAKLLWLSAGETDTIGVPGQPDIVQPLRAAPSAGALHSVEIYPVLLNVEGAEPGLYHYNVPEHSLELLRGGDFRPAMNNHLLAPELMPNAAAVLVLTGVLTRLLAKYGDRGYRFLLLGLQLAQFAVVEQFGVAVGNGQRRAQLVRDVLDELTLQPVEIPLLRQCSG